MEWLIFAGVLAVLVPLGVLAQKKGWIDVTGSGVGRASGGSAPLGGFDEVFQPTRYEAQLEMDRQALLPAEAPTPGDPARADIFDGPVRIDLDQLKR